MRRRSRTLQLLELQMHASDKQLLAALMTLAERMAAVTGRTKLKWEYAASARSPTA